MPIAPKTSNVLQVWGNLHIAWVDKFANVNQTMDFSVEHATFRPN